MATSVDQLLTEAQRQLWRTVRPLPPAPERRPTAALRRRAHLQAWPELAVAARYALGASFPSAGGGDLVVHRPVPQRLLPTLQHLERTVMTLQRARPSDIPGDPQLLRTAELLATVGDALADRAAADRDVGTTDRILDLVAAAAIVTAGYAEQAPAGITVLQRPGPWFALASTAREACVTLPGQRDAAAAMRPIVTIGERSLGADLEAFRHAALEALIPTRTPTTDLPLVARVLARVHLVAAANDPPGLHHRAGLGWHAASASWTPAVRIPGPPHPQLRQAAMAISAALTTDLDSRRSRRCALLR